jgi:cholesterol transport system auxiliary component
MLLCLGLLLGGCTTFSGSNTTPANFYDLGPLSATTPAAAAGTAPATQPAIAVTVADVTPAPWLDSQLMFYRLLYANAQQPRAYAQQRWAMPPAALLTQRLKARIVQSGGIAASAADGPTNLLQLRIEADDFAHAFETPEKSYGQISLRASLYNGRTLMAQKNFAVRAPAPSNDAQGGVRALAAASDAAITDMLSWLARQPLKR